MTRLELGRIRVCSRCGRGAAELRGADGESVVVPLDAVRARELSGKGDGLRSVTDVLLDQLAAAGTAVSEVVLDVSDGRLRALMTLVRDGETDVVGATAEEGVALTLRGDLKLYATDEAIAHAAARSAKPARPGGAGGSDTIH